MAFPPSDAPSDTPLDAPSGAFDPGPAVDSDAAPESEPRPTPPAPASLHGLRDLVRALRSSRRFIDVLEITAEQARAALGATSVSLSQWERDRGRLVTRVNVGRLAPGEVRFPQDEVYELARDALDLLEGSGMIVDGDDPESPIQDRTVLRQTGMSCGLTVPVPSEGRLWGELWVARDRSAPAYAATDLAFAREVAELIGEVIASSELLERTARLAFEDPLTRLGNRRAFDDRLRELLADDGPGATVVLCDLDGLKDINDTEGHSAGDRVITGAADALAAVASRLTDCVATRIGGDEFALLLPGETRGVAVQAVERAAALLARHRLGTTMSCGVAAAPAGTTPRVLVVTADTALYAAKRRGAQLVLSSDLGDSDGAELDEPVARAVAGVERAGRRIHRRRWDDDVDRPYPSDASGAVAAAVQALAEGVDERPADLPSALRWIGDTLLGPLDLDRWTLREVRPGPDGEEFTLDSLGMRRSRMALRADEQQFVEEHFPLASYPREAGAVEHRTIYTMDTAEPDTADPPHDDERMTLRDMGIRYIVGAGGEEGGRRWLLALLARSEHVPMAAVRDMLALALASAGTGISGIGYEPSAEPVDQVG